MNGYRTALTLSLMAGLATQAHAADPWPGEAWQQSTVLTGLDPDFRNNLSGAHWNDRTQTLWVCTNGPGRFWSLVPDGRGGMVVASAAGRRGEFDAPGDLEGITQAEDDGSVYVIAEGIDRIRRYDVTTLGAPRLTNEFDIRAHVPAYNGSAGSEGIAFVPDAALAARGFVDGNGRRYTSRRGMGGLMFVAHQNGGAVFAFDLDRATNGVTFVGRYETARGESSGLEFDRSTNHLYVWHNTGSNTAEVTDLTSTVVDGRRRFRTVREFVGPKTGNLEGIALSPVAEGAGWYFATDDDNQNGAALMWFHDFDPGLAPPPEPAVQTFAARVVGGANDVEQRSNGTMSMNSTDLELVTDGAAQIVGMRFEGVTVPPRAEIVDAYLQFTVDEVTTGATQLVIRGEARGDAAPFANVARHLSGRATTAARVAWAPAAWRTIDAAGAAQQTPSLGAVVQEIVDRPDYNAGNAMAFLVTGSGKRTARATESAAAKAPRLVIEYIAPVVRTVEARIRRGADDVEQRSNGTVSTNSTDLELVDDGGAQTVGLRFEGLGIPAGARILRAAIQFATDEAGNGNTQVAIRGEAAANPAAFAATANNLSLRRTTAASVAWAIAPWATIGEAGAAQKTPDLASIVQELVRIQGYTAQSALHFLITGAGRRTAEAYDGDAARAPRLVVEYVE